jgi:hypothetical protein
MKLVRSNPLGIPPARYDVDKDGVNASLLGRWLSCRELARLYLLGWTPRSISAGRIFGVIVHQVQDAIYSDLQNGELDSLPSNKRVIREVRKAEAAWKKQNPRADAKTLQTLEMNVILAEAIMPVYFKFWHQDIMKMDWMSLEHKFRTPIAGTHLIGRMDGNFRTVKGKKLLWLFETKSKSRIGDRGESNLSNILPHELQVNLYLGARVLRYKETPGGVVMNIIRRPGFKLKKNEGPQGFAARVAKDVQRRPEYYFIRMRMTVDKKDLERMRLEHDALVKDYTQWARGKGYHYRNSGQCENKYGTCDYLLVCANQDYTGLYQREPRIRKEDVEVEE